MALSSDGVVYSWGLNQFGQLGDGNYQDRNEPVEVFFNSNSSLNPFITNISAGFYFSIALSSNGNLFFWGTLLKKKSLIANPFDFNSSSFSNQISQIAAGTYHFFFVLKDEERIFGFGENIYGQLGNGDRKSVV